MSINFSGLASGLDTNAIINELMRLERMPIVRLQNRQKDYGSQLSILGTIKSKMSTLQTAAQDLDSLTEFFSYSANTSNEDVLTATASGSATPGAYDITVNALAKAERTYSVTGFADKTALGVVGTGDITITVGAEAPVVIGVDQSTDSLETVRDAINASSAKVNASIIYDGTDYHLVVQGTGTGTDNSIVMGDTTSIDVTDERQAATNASITMDTITMTSQDNDIEEIIEGVTLNLVATGAATITVDADKDTIRGKVDTFINAYNAVLGDINKQFEFTGTSKGQNTLAGDSTLRSALAKLQGLITNQVSGLTGKYTALSEIGVKSDGKTGALSLDSTIFDDAIGDDIRAAGLVFVKEGSTTGIASLIDNAVDELTDIVSGSLTLREKGINDTIDRIDDDIERLEFNVGLTEQALIRQFTALEQLISKMNASTFSLTQLPSLNQ